MEERKIQAGDQVECISAVSKYDHWGDDCAVASGDVCVVVEYSKKDGFGDRIDVRVPGKGVNHAAKVSDFKLYKPVEKKKNIMTSIIDKVKLALKAEPQKTLISRGVLNADETLTTEGRALLEHLLVQKHALELKEAVDKVPVEKPE